MIVEDGKGDVDDGESPFELVVQTRSNDNTIVLDLRTMSTCTPRTSGMKNSLSAKKF